MAQEWNASNMTGRNNQVKAYNFGLLVGELDIFWTDKQAEHVSCDIRTIEVGYFT